MSDARPYARTTQRLARFNPDPIKAIRWGDATSDEMMLGYFEYFEGNVAASQSAHNQE
jgi:hypothetical protein